MSTLQQFSEKFQTRNLMVFETSHWIVSLRPQQVTLGSLILSLKRDCTSLGDLSPDESSELQQVFKGIESVLKKCFEYDKINYLCLMMVDSQVHFHVLPRYESVKAFGSFTIVDEGWPGVPTLSKFIEDEKLLDLLKTYIKHRL